MRSLRGTFWVWLSIGCVTAASASTSRWMSLDEMVAHADRIVLGHCVAVVPEHDPALDLDVVRVTSEVRGVLKGTVPHQLVFRQAALQVAGLPEFHEGDESLLLLYPESRTGLTTAVGLTQGAFGLQRDKQGRSFAMNGFGNRRLLSPTDPGGAIEEARLVGLIEAAVRQQK